MFARTRVRSSMANGVRRSETFIAQLDYSQPMAPFITHAQLRVGDLERSLGFYRDLLGFTVHSDAGGSVGLAPEGAASETLTLREVRGLKHRPRHPRTAGLYHVAWLVPSRPDLGRALDGLRRAFYPLTGASDHAVSESLYLDDPDGNGVEIYADKPRDTWKWSNGRVHMTVDPLDLEGLLHDAHGASASAKASADKPAHVLTAGTVIGHVHFVVPNLDEAKRYWNTDVGLDITLEWPMLVGLSHGGYHHHVNLNNWAGEGAPADDPGVAGLDSVTMGGKTLKP
ncbi:MAG: glyoxalase [Acidobacteria bacterium]|nr:MAG: glyoxalase [Acidobacteriota bacterium]